MSDCVRHQVMSASNFSLKRVALHVICLLRRQEAERRHNAILDECFTYDDFLRKNGHFAGGEGLESPRNATTLRWRNGQVSITDGPYTETKKQLGGILILEATDVNHAVQLMSKHPSLKYGNIFEIRAVDMTETCRESERRRAGRG